MGREGKNESGGLTLKMRMGESKFLMCVLDLLIVFLSSCFMVCILCLALEF